MNLRELEAFLSSLPDKMMGDCAEIVAETATEYFKETFRKKAFDGNPWTPAKTPKRRGSLLIDSGAMLNSIRPLVISPQRVVIAAGNQKVTYARVHNEGYDGEVQVPAHTRRTKKGSTNVKAHTRTAHVIQRQFMGDSEELNDRIKSRVVDYIKTLTNE
ncbi:phage virion morphogenesis protein [Prevotella falsenii]|uniref:phage virion morphogenesis protein n=1 Tax=Prevotella falsenii TaxID=515414 RepID=UPI0004686B02|nr:phage virion morphogenesis protein [Prevotella falsenii]